MTAEMPHGPGPSQPRGRVGWQAVVIGILVGLVIASGVVALALSRGGDDDSSTTTAPPGQPPSTAGDGSTTTLDEGPAESSSTTSTTVAAPSPDPHGIMIAGHVAGRWTGTEWARGATVDQVAGQQFIDTATSAPIVADSLEPAEFCYAEDGTPSVPRYDVGEVDGPLDPLAVSDLDWPTRRGDIVGIAPAAAHEESVRRWLESVGLGDQPVVIERTLRFDIEGDGTDEVLLVAHQGETWLYGSTPGAYSTIILRRVGAGGEVTDSVLAGEAASPDAPRATDDPSLVEAWVPTYREIDVVDLNGDGRLELVTEDEVYESWGWHVHDLGPTPAEVLHIACGV